MVGALLSLAAAWAGDCAVADEFETAMDAIRSFDVSVQPTLSTHMMVRL